MRTMGICSLDELGQRMSQDDLNHFLALEYLQPSSPRRFEMCLGFIVQAILAIQYCLTGSKKELPPWDELMLAPIDSTPEAQQARLQEKIKNTAEQGRAYFMAMKRAQDKEAERLGKKPDTRSLEDRIREL